MSLCIEPAVAKTGHSVGNRVRVITLSMMIAMAAVAVAFAGPGVGGGLLLMMLCAFAVGVALLRWPLHAMRGRLSTMRYGLWLSVFGGLLMLLALLSGQGDVHLWPGILLSGLGSGMTRGSLVKTLTTREWALVAVASALTLATISLITLFSASGIERFCFALALPIDLALLGVLIVGIAENEER